MTSNARSTRDRAPKYSIVLSNVLAVVFRPTSTAVGVTNVRHTENCDKQDSKPTHQTNGLELFDAFKEANRSTLVTRLTESLDEIRLKGWVFPFTLLIKGPHEDVEVIKEAWRRHFLRSPDNFIIKDIGTVSSVDMEVIQQAPFLPLTISLMETISALNKSQLTATQQSIAELLAKTYQYVHVPKLNVIHDCLGILIKERRIYHTGKGYFVSAENPSDKPEAPPKENGDVHESKESECVAREALSKGITAKSEKAKKKTKAKELQNEKVKTSGKEKEKVESEKGFDCAEPAAKESRGKLHGREEDTNKAKSETTSESGTSEGTTKKPKKQKKGVLDRISCFVKGKAFPSSEFEVTKQDQTVTTPSPHQQSTASHVTAPLAIQDDIARSMLQSSQFRNQRTLSAPAESPHTLNSNISTKETTEHEEFRKGEIKGEVPISRQLLRSKSFVASEQRPAPLVRVMRSNSFAAPSTKAARQIAAESATGHWDRRVRMTYGNIVRNSPRRQTIHVSRPNSCNIGIVRPLSTNQQRTISRSHSVKKDKPGKKEGSLSPPSTPRNQLTPRGIPPLNDKSQSRTNHFVARSRSFTEPGVLRLANRQISHRATIAGPHFESPLQQLLARKPHGYLSPPSPSVRVTVQPKGRHFVPGKRSTTPPKRTPPSTPVRKPQAPTQKQMPDIPRNKQGCPSPVCYHSTLINNKVENCMCTVGINSANGTQFAPVFLPKDNYNKYVGLQPDEGSSDHICIEEMTPTASELTLVQEGYVETGTDYDSKPLGMYKKETEEGINDSLTFIGII